MKPIALTDYLSPSLAETNAGNCGTNNNYFTEISLEFPLWLQMVSGLAAKQNSLLFYKRMDQKSSLFFKFTATAYITYSCFYLFFVSL